MRTKADELVNIELVINLGHPTLSSTHPSLAPETGRKNNNPTVNKYRKLPTVEACEAANPDLGLNNCR